MSPKALAVVLWLVIIIASIYGWVMNLLAVIAVTVFTGKALVGAIGIVVFPVGVIMGLFVW